MLIRALSQKNSALTLSLIMHNGKTGVIPISLSQKRTLQARSAVIKTMCRTKRASTAPKSSVTPMISTLSLREDTEVPAALEATRRHVSTTKMS